jgi:hypothetical protein
VSDLVVGKRMVRKRGEERREEKRREEKRKDVTVLNLANSNNVALSRLRDDRAEK